MRKLALFIPFALIVFISPGSPYLAERLLGVSDPVPPEIAVAAKTVALLALLAGSVLTFLLTVHRAYMQNRLWSPWTFRLPAHPLVVWPLAVILTACLFPIALVLEFGTMVRIAWSDTFGSLRSMVDEILVAGA